MAGGKARENKVTPSLQDRLSGHKRESEMCRTPEGGTKPRERRTVSSVKNDEVTKLRAKMAVTLQARGVSNTEIAEFLGVTSNGGNFGTSKVTQLIKLAASEGWVTEVRERFVTLSLAKAEKVYNEILDAPAETLELHSKGWTIKEKAAKVVLEGTGTLGKTQAKSSATTSYTLDRYLSERQAGADIVEAGRADQADAGGISGLLPLDAEVIVGGPERSGGLGDGAGGDPGVVDQPDDDDGA